jgi:multiple antibiotic resistance protein
MDIYQLTNYTVALFVVCNPFSALPALLRFTTGESIQEKRKTGLVTTFSVAVILLIVTWIGGPFLKFLGIKVPAFQIAGGLIVLLMSLSMLNAQVSPMKQTDEEKKEAKEKENVAVVPLGMPIIAGPAAISTVIVNASIFPNFINLVYMTLCAGVVTLLMGVILYYAANLEKFLGKVGLNIFTRIGGLILAANSVDTLSQGIKGLFPGTLS